MADSRDQLPWEFEGRKEGLRAMAIWFGNLDSASGAIREFAVWAALNEGAVAEIFRRGFTEDEGTGGNLVQYGPNGPRLFEFGAGQCRHVLAGLVIAYRRSKVDNEVRNSWIGIHWPGRGRDVPVGLVRRREWARRRGRSVVATDPRRRLDERTPFNGPDGLIESLPDPAREDPLGRLCSEEELASKLEFLKWAGPRFARRASTVQMAVTDLMRDGVPRAEIVRLYGENAYKSTLDKWMRLLRAWRREQQALRMAQQAQETA